MKRNSTIQQALLASTAAILASTPAIAQNNAPSASDGADNGDAIIVTARKREETLLDVPLSVTALTAETIKDQGVNEIRDVVNLTPGLSLSEFGAGTLNVPVIRGLTNLTGSAFAENNVSVFYNGVYIQNSNLIDATFLDVERIEVIKGPVSSLYGRNAYAGVINYVVARPSKTLSVSGNGLVGTRGRLAAEARVSGPIAGDVLSATIAARYEGSNGSYEDPVNGIRFGGYDKRAIQAVVEVDPGDEFNLLGTLFYGNDRFDQPMRALANFGGNFIGQGNCGAAANAFQTTICGQVPDADDNTVVRSSNPQFELYGNRRKVWFGTLEANVDVGALQFKSLSSFSNINYNMRRDQDGTGVGFAYALSGTPAATANLSSYVIQEAADSSFQQELRATLEASDSLIFTLGGFYNRYVSDQTAGFLIDPSPVPAGRTPSQTLIAYLDPVTAAFTQAQFTRFTDEEISAFGMIEFKPTPELTLSAEGRRSQQNKLQNQRSMTFTGNFNDLDGPGGIKGEWKFWSWRFSGQYKPSSGTMIYASAARANKAGGFNPGSLNPVDLQFDPENNTTYEVGFKSELFGRRATFDIAVFYADLTDLQLTGVTADGLRTAISNAGEAKAYGVEASITGRLAQGVQLGIGVAYANPTFKDGSFLNSGQTRTQCLNIPNCAPRVQTIPGSTIRGTELGGLSLPRQSDWQFNTTLDVRRPLTDTLDWTLRGYYAYESEQFAAFPPINEAFIGDRHTLNARIGIATDNFSLAAFVENALDDGTPLNFGSQFNGSNFQTPLGIVYPDKRTFGIEGSFRF